MHEVEWDEFHEGGMKEKLYWAVVAVTVSIQSSY